MGSLYELTQDVLYLQSLLEDGEIDDQTYLDTVEGMCIEGKIESICKVMKNLEAKAEMYKGEIDRMTSRKRTLENSVRRLKESMLNYMLTTNEKKVEAGLFTVGIGKSKSVNILDMGKLPNEFILPQEPKIDRQGIAKAIRNGEEIEGAELVENPYVTIR